ATSWSGYGEFVHSFDEAGTYTVTGWVKDHAGNEQSKTAEVTVWKGAEDVAQEQQGSEIPLMALLGGLFILVLLVFFLIQVVVIMKRRNQPRMPSGHHGRNPLPHRPADQLTPPHAGGVENGGQDQIEHVVQGDIISLPEHLRN
ncbi:MAG: PKD domain-containing protein, partial [Thermoplasmata archaeon]|nr:PKD domain-containing protein [Thermoplasmata archaeon]